MTSNHEDEERRRNRRMVTRHSRMRSCPETSMPALQRKRVGSPEKTSLALPIWRERI